MDHPHSERFHGLPRSPLAPGLATLAEHLAEEMAQRWRRGERPLVEEFLARHPELGRHEEAAVQLINEEICLRREHLREVSFTHMVRRFPAWQAQLEVLLNCHRLLESDLVEPVFPEVGGQWRDFQLRAELGRGAVGRVYLATQPALADRPVVLKLGPAGSQEHLSLARLQHTAIVPMYSVFEDRDNLLAICMPYFGGATLAHVLDALGDHPVRERSGRQLVEVLDRCQQTAAIPLPAVGPARTHLSRCSYVEGVCWLGACVADALQYAHERNLLHLDVKPSNILLAADGQPMLLDFHLAQGAIRVGAPIPESWGGTPAYMSPEQWSLLTVPDGQKAPTVVDGRSDVYSLGLVLHEALSNQRPTRGAVPPPLRAMNPFISRGLSDVIGKCLAARPDDRYPSAAALAEDLRRHLANQPLRGVANRSVRERWRKWRCRKPFALPMTLMLVLALAAAAALVSHTLIQSGRQREEARTALHDGELRLHNHEYAEAVRTLERGRSLAQGLLAGRELEQQLSARLRLARRALAAQDLSRLVDGVRFLYGIDPWPVARGAQLENHCRELWKARQLLGDRSGGELEAEVELRIQRDLLDLAILGADLHVRQSPNDQLPQARQEALQWLAEAEKLYGPSPILERERQRYAGALGLTELARQAAQRLPELPARTAWEHYALGQTWLRSGDLAAAAAAFDQALALQPGDFWSNFYAGACAFRRQRYQDAVQAYHVCIALAPAAPECFFNRALAYTGLGKLAQAVSDYSRALELNPAWGEAALNRGILYYRERRYNRALADLHQALRHRADAATVHYHQALVHLALKDRISALESLQKTLYHERGHSQARAMYDRLQLQR
jgi:serine/threonine protein kinase/Tfp pilus assembly protein PilF